MPSLKETANAVYSSPPRAPLAFRAGVVGHRPNRLKEADLAVLAGELRAILNAVKEEVETAQRESDGLYTNDAPILRALSPLAEGVDRIFAEQALDLGYELCCVTPFPKEEFKNDFEANYSRDHFESILSRARAETNLTLFQLDGSRSDNESAYGAAGRVVLNQSDLLVVVWDGKRKGKRGGTEETFDEARERGIPVVWVDAKMPHHWQLVNATTQIPMPEESEPVSPDGPSNLTGLRNMVQSALVLPAHDNSEKPPAYGRASGDKRRLRLERFYAEGQPAFTLAVAWKAFRDVVGDGIPPRVQFTVRAFEEAVQDEWPRDRATPIAALVDTLRPYYAWPDKLAVLYSDRYRSAYVAAFFLAAVAVGMALLPVGARLTPHHPGETLCIALELVCIVVILALIWFGRRGRWHQRWLAYRLAAELVRHLRLIAPLGGKRPFPQIPAQWATYGLPGASWMAWYVRAIERALGLPAVEVTRDYLSASLVHLRASVDGQADWHETNCERAGRIDHNLHVSSITLLVVTLLACAMHLLPGIWHFIHYPGWLPPALTFLCGFCPALGAAMAGIINQGEFRRLEKRSKAMKEQLEIISKSMKELQAEMDAAPSGKGKQFSPRVASLASDAAGLLVNEVLDWRVVFLDQPLKPPG